MATSLTTTPEPPAAQTVIDFCSLTFFQSIFNADQLIKNLAEQYYFPPTTSGHNNDMFMSCHGHKTLASIGLVLLLKLIDDLKPYVLLKRTDSSEAIKQLLDGFTNENAMDSQEHCQDIHDLIMEICRKNLKGRLGEYPMTTLLPIEKVMEDESEEGKSVERFIALYFNVNLSSLKQIEKQEKVLAVGLKIIVCYVMGEIVELASNYTRDCSCFSVGQPAIENAIKYDSELLESLPSSICSINILILLKFQLEKVQFFHPSHQMFIQIF